MKRNKNRLDNEDGSESFPDFNFSDIIDVYEKNNIRKCYLFGEINSYSVLNIIMSIDFLESLDSKEEISIIINSSGGYIPDCLALIDAMDNCSCRIKTVVFGQASSAACLIASNGDPELRFSGENSEFMYHEGLSFIPEVKLSQMPYYFDESIRLEEKCNKIFCRNTGRTIDEIKDSFLRRETDKFMTAKEAKNFGIIDKVFPVKNRKKKIKK